MSVCRFFWEGSDVYVFYHVDGYLTCCWCALSDEEYGDFRCDPYDDQAMVSHLQEHVEAGHTVPEHAFQHFNAEHPDLNAFHDARDAWRDEHEAKYGWMWDPTERPDPPTETEADD